MTRTGRILIWIVVAIAVLLVAIVLFVAFFNWNSARPWLDQRLSDSIGRPVAINGDLTVNWLRNPDAGGVAHWVPWPRFTAQDISIANPGWAQQPLRDGAAGALQPEPVGVALAHHRYSLAQALRSRR